MNDILIEIDKLISTYGTIGIFVSGGFDSAMLSYLAHESKLRTGSSVKFEFFTVPRFDDSKVHARRIIDFIENQFNISNTPWHIVGNPSLHHSRQVSSGILSAIINHSYLDIIMTAGNSTPIEIPDGPIRPHPSIHPKLRKPFFDYTKDIIVQMCIDRGLTEIMELSHTCTESTTLRCNMCWQCKERAWAFKKCNYEDPGTM